MLTVKRGNGVMTSFKLKITQPSKGLAVQRLSELIKRNRCRIALVLGTSLLGSCAFTDSNRSIVLKVAQASKENEQQSINRFESERTISKNFQQQLREMQPGIKLHPSIYAEESLEQELKVQTNSGLGLDLVITNSNQALSLAADGLTDPIKLTKELENLINPAPWSALKLPVERSQGNRSRNTYSSLASTNASQKSTKNPDGTVRSQWKRAGFWNGHQPPGSLLEPWQLRSRRGISHLPSRQTSH